MQPIEFQVCPTNQDYPVCYVLDDGYCYQLLNNKMNYSDQTFEVQRVRSACERPIRITKERIVRILELSQIKIIATLAWIPIEPTKYYHGIPAKDLQYIKQKIEQLFSKNADPVNRGRIYPKYSDSIAISSRYAISREDIDQNGVINAQPKFISWSLVSKQNIIDKSCVLQPYTCSNCDMNCVIDPSKEWNQQKVVKHIGQQIAKEVDQDIVEELINIKEQKLFECGLGQIMKKRLKRRQND